MVAAGELMTRDGYARTSIAAIARGADVAVQTVYNAVGSKRDVLEAVLDRAASGPEAPRSVPEFMAERADAATTAVGMVEVLADWFAQSQPRVAAVMRLIREAAAVDEGVAELERERASRRLHNYGMAADQLAGKPGAVAMERDAAAAIIWSIGHPQTYGHLVEVEGWDVARYRDWVAATLRAALTSHAEW